MKMIIATILLLVFAILLVPGCTVSLSDQQNANNGQVTDATNTGAQGESNALGKDTNAQNNEQENKTLDGKESAPEEKEVETSDVLENQETEENETEQVDSCEGSLVFIDNHCCEDINANSICDENEVDNEEPASDSTVETEPVEVICGDDICSAGETPDDCCIDCGCEDNLICDEDNECITQSENISINFSLNFNIKRASLCGDGYCNDKGMQLNPENSTNCCTDCGCVFGVCNDETKKCELKLAGLKMIGVGSNDSSELSYNEILNRLSTDDYLLLTLDDVKFMRETYDKDKCNMYGKCIKTPYEPMIFARANSGDEKQEVAFPMAVTGSVYINSTFITGKIPIFSKNLENIDDINFKISLAEADKYLTMPSINYDNSEDTLNSVFFYKNDNLGTFSKVLKKSKNYNLGTHSYNLEEAKLKYTVQKVKKINDMKVKLKLNKVIFNYDGDRYDDGELYLWYRISDQPVYDEFGTSYQYESHQRAGTIHLTRDKYTYSNENEYISVDVEGKELFSTDDMGPFLYAEFQLVDLDSGCKNLPGIPFDCVNTDKKDMLTSVSLFYDADSKKFITKPDETVQFTDSEIDFFGKSMISGVEIEIERGPLFNN